MLRLIAPVLLLFLAGCGESPQEAAIESNAAALQASLEAQADNMEAMADAAADRNAAEAIEDAADRLEDEKAEVANAAEASKSELRP
jgi:outer membrane lipoprotein-sorting protein